MIREEIQQRLRSDFRRLNKQFVLPQIFLLVSLLFIFPIRDSFLLPFSVTGLLLVGRFLLDFILKEKDRPKLLNFASVLIIGLGWGGIFISLFSRDDFFDTKSIYLFGVFFVLMGQGASTLSSSLRTSLIYITSLMIYPFYLLAFELKTYEIAFLIFGNYLYQGWRIFERNSQLKKNYLDQAHINSDNNFLNNVLDVIPGLVLLVDEEGYYRVVNNFRDGLIKEKVLNKPLGCFEPDGDFLKSLLKFREGQLTEDVTEIKSNFFETEEWFMVHFKRISVPINGIVVVVLSTTELTIAKNDLKIHEARSKYSSKLASLGEFSASIAHEINNPLTIIEGATNLIKILLREEPIDRYALDKSADKVILTTQRIARIIKSLRMLSGNVKEEPFNNVSFMDIVEPSLEITKSKLLEHNIELRINPGKENIPLFGNEIQLSQVIMNLVSNSIDAIKDQEGSRWIEIQYCPSVIWLDILIHDSGLGVSEEIAGKMMEPFFTTKSSNQGTGLGLSISKSILDSHGATIELVKEMKNTVFRIRFPRMSTKN